MTHDQSIWNGPVSLDGINTFGSSTMAGHLGIVFTEIGDDYLKATMPVDHRTHQPFGLLHGGASVVLAETMGSIAAYLTVDQTRQVVVGLDINANHVRGVRTGHVVGTVTPVHRGRTTQVWQIHIHDEAGRLVCISRITMAILDQRG